MKRKFLTLVAGLGAMLGLTGITMADPLELGKAVPSIETKNHKGQTVKLHEAAAKGLALVYFYPKAATPG